MVSFVEKFNPEADPSSAGLSPLIVFSARSGRKPEE
jgi:hypothetical protein